MSRLNSQSRLSQGPRDLELPRSFLASPQRIAPASTANLGAILQGAVQVSAQVLAQNKAAQQRQDAEDFQTILNQLTLRQSEYNQDPTEANATLLLQDYESARERFTDPKHQAHLLQFGEPFKTSLVSQEAKRQSAAAKGYLVETGRKLSAMLSQDMGFIEEIRDLPFDKQIETIRSQILYELPEGLIDNVESEEALQSLVTNLTLEVQETADAARKQYIKGQEAIARRSAGYAAYGNIMGGADPEAEINTLVTEQGIAREDAETALATSAISELEVQQEIGNLDDLAQQVVIGHRLLGALPPGHDRSELATALGASQKQIVDTSVEILDSRATILRTAGADPEAIAASVEDEALGIASSIFRTPFNTMEEFASYVPDNNSERAMKRSLMQVFEDFQTTEAEINSTITNAATALITPSAVSAGDVAGLVDLPPDRQQQVITTLQERLIPADGEGPVDYETMAVLDAAKDDRASYLRLLTQQASDTPYAGAVVSRIRPEIFNGPVDEESMRKVEQVLIGLSGSQDIRPEDISLLAGDDHATEYALYRTTENFTQTGVFDPNLFNERKEEYEQLVYNTSDLENASFWDVLSDQDVVKRVLGKGNWFTRGKNDVPDADLIANMQFSDKNKSLILAAIDLADINPAGSNDKTMVASAINEAMDRAGIYVIADTSFGPRGRAVVTRSQVVPEAVGSSTAQINKAFVNRRSAVDRYIASVMSEGEHNSVWQIAADALQSITITDEGARSLMTFDELIRRKDAGTARIVAAGADHRRDGVPIRLILSTDDGDNEQTYDIGVFNFGSEISARFFASGLTSKSYKSPPEPKKTISEEVEGVRTRANKSLSGVKSYFNNLRDDVNRSLEPTRQGYQQEADNINDLLGQ